MYSLVVSEEGGSGNSAMWLALWRSFPLLHFLIETMDGVMVGLDRADRQHSKGDVMAWS